MDDDDLLARLLTLSGTPCLLVAADYDGTIAPIVDDPAAAHPDEESIRLLAELSALANTEVAIISGRAREELANFTSLPPEVHLIGSHGSEFEADWSTQLPESVVRLREQIAGELEAIAADVPGAFVEHKPTSAALHVRRADPGERETAVVRALEVPDRIDGVTVKMGKLVVELCALAADKGTALARLMQTVQASSVVFIGDDDTDEDAFAVLTADDLGVKVGPGPTAAPVRVATTDDVELVLAHLLQLRAAHVASSSEATG